MHTKIGERVRHYHDQGCANLSRCGMYAYIRVVPRARTCGTAPHLSEKKIKEQNLKLQLSFQLRYSGVMVTLSGT